MGINTQLVCLSPEESNQMVVVLNTMSYADCLMQKKQRMPRKGSCKACQAHKSKMLSGLIENAEIQRLHLPSVEEEDNNEPTPVLMAGW